MIKNIILVLTAISLLASCKTTEVKSTDLTTKNKDNSNFGQLVEKHFFSTGFSIDINIPDSWSVSGQETIDAASKIGEKIVTGNDAVKKILYEESKKRTENIFLISRYEVGAPVSFNPSIISSSEHVALAPGIKSGKDYLFHIEKILLESKANYEIINRNSPLTVSGYTFDSFTAKVITSRSEAYQTYYAAKLGSYVLSFALTYSTKEENILLDNIFQSILIKKRLKG